MADQVIIYTDGGADPNPGIGGWAAVLQFGDHEKVLTGHDPQTTNNRMELQAAIGALQALKRPCVIEFHTDSEYLRKGITEWIEKWAAKGFRKGGKPIPNADLWQTLWPLTKAHEIEWHWVRGHAGNPLNERVDDLARQARLAITPEEELSATMPRLYVRASCKGNPGPGGWGVVLERGEETEQLSGSVPNTTNNRMEITAVIEGLLLIPPGGAVQIFTTSDYLFQGATRWILGWRKNNWQKKDGQAVANADLWQALDQQLAHYKVRWINAKGQDIPALSEASQIAAEARDVV
ncbi:MAG: ribonuclease HI [Ardenticatenaceae bacterium]|nr:ribonuclease HI [Ardenticatenaceae bacterium]